MAKGKEPGVVEIQKEFFTARPIKPDLGVLGHKWALVILTDIGLRQVDRFSGLLRSSPDLTPRVLSRRLRELEESGMIRKAEAGRPPRPVRWAVTEKGSETLPVLVRFIAFGARWYADNPFRGTLPRTLQMQRVKTHLA